MAPSFASEATVEGQLAFNQTIPVGSTPTRRTTFKSFHIFIGVIRLQDILKEITDAQKSTSWLDPRGNFHHVDYNHGSTAAKLVGNNDDPMLTLWNRGWQRVTYYSQGTLFANNEIMPPNEIQTKKLIELTKAIGFNELKYDAGEGVKTLWSKDDVLEGLPSK